MTSQPPDASSIAEQVEFLRNRVLQLEAQNSARASRVAGAKKGLLAAVLVLVASNVAWAQLKTFVAGAPALANDVNSNFTQLKTWLEHGTNQSARSAVDSSHMLESGCNGIRRLLPLSRCRLFSRQV